MAGADRRFFMGGIEHYFRHPSQAFRIVFLQSMAYGLYRLDPLDNGHGYWRLVDR